MTAIGIASPGGPDVLVPQERPVPTPGEGEILVKVARSLPPESIVQMSPSAAACTRRRPA
jgi:hypothetical protein